MRARAQGLRGPLRTLLAVWMLVDIGAWAFLVALGVYAFHASGPGGVAAVTAARLLPGVIAAPFAGHLIDRTDRGRVVALAAIVQMATVGTAAAVAIANGSLAIVVLLAAASSVAATAPRPALQALMPALASSPRELTSATAIWSAVDNVGFLVGGGLAGVAMAAVGTGAVMAAAACLFGLAAIVSARLPSVSALPAHDHQDDAERLSGLLAGLTAVARSPMLRAPYALFAGLLLLEGVSDVQLVALSLGKLGLGNGGPGLLYTLWGAGGLLGAGVLLILVRRRGYGLALFVGALTFAAGLAATGGDGVPLALVAMIPAGVGFALVETAVIGLVPRLANDTIVGRVYALSESLYAAAAGVGALIAPLLISAFGAAGSLAVVGVAFASGAVLAGRSCTRLDIDQEKAGRVRELLRRIPFLRALPLPLLERLVRGARSVEFPAGTDIVRLGEPGDEYFVIEDGTVEIVEFARRCGPGQGFGEIALLRDSPRTATARATTPVRLWALTRTAFVAAVVGHGEARELANAIVAEQLARPGLAAAAPPDAF